MRAAVARAAALALAALACAQAQGPPPGSGWGRVGPEPASLEPGAGRVRVRFPIGSCVTGWIEVEEFDRDHGTWAPHAAGDLVRAGSCRLEDAHRLLNEIRVRCVDPEGARAPSPWIVGVDLDPSAQGARGCEDARPGES